MNPPLRLAIFGLLLCFTLSSVAQDAKVKELMDAGDRLVELNNEGAALSKYRKALEIDPHGADALYKAGFLAIRVGRRMNEPENREKYFRYGFDYGEDLTELKPNDPEGYFLMGFALLYLSEEEKTRTIADHYTDIYKYARLSLKADPQFAGGWYILGRWNAYLTDLSIKDQAQFKLINSDLLKQASAVNAIRSYSNALTYDPANMEYLYELAKVYLSINEPDLARKTLAKVTTRKAIGPEEENYKALCQKMMDNL